MAIRSYDQHAFWQPRKMARGRQSKQTFFVPEGRGSVALFLLCFAFSSFATRLRLSNAKTSLAGAVVVKSLVNVHSCGPPTHLQAHLLEDLEPLLVSALVNSVTR